MTGTYSFAATSNSSEGGEVDAGERSIESWDSDVHTSVRPAKRRILLSAAATWM